MNIKPFKNLKCYSCKTNLILNVSIDKDKDYLFYCENKFCKLKKRINKIDYIIKITINTENHNLSGVFSLNDSFEENYGFYCNDYNIYIGTYPNWIQLNNCTFFELLNQYLIDSDINKIKEKYQTLKLFT